MTISIIAAVAENNVIGKDNDLIWHISEDLKRFKSLTSGHTVIMGRKTYESLPFKPLPNRKNIIITKDKSAHFAGTVIVNSPEEAIKKCENEDEIYICGGATIYNYFINKAHKMYLTKVLKKFEGDTFFPDIEVKDWDITEISDIRYDPKYNLSYQFINMIKKSI